MEKYLEEFQDLAVQYGLKLVIAIVILIVGFWLSKVIARAAAKALAKKSDNQGLISFTKSLVGALVKVAVIIAAVQQFGVEMTSFIAVLGAAGLAVGLALSGTLQNFAGGFMILLLKPFKVGDYVEMQGYSGTVVDIQIFYTVLNTPDNKRIIIPNAPISTGALVNYSAEAKRRVDFTFGIGYGDDIDKARKVLQDIIQADDRIDDTPEPAIVISALADSSVNFGVKVWANKEDYWGIYFDLTEKVKKAFDENDINIPFPQTDVHLHQVQ